MSGKKREKRKRRIWPWLAAGALVLAGIAAVGIPFAFSGAGKSALVKVPQGASAEQLGDTLRKYFGSEYAGKVLTVVKLQPGDVGTRHGAYMVEKGMSPLRAARLIMRGAQEPVNITINGFRDLDEMADRIARKMEFSPKTLRAALASDTVLKEYGLTPQQALGLFLNDTYQVYWTTTAEELIKKVGAHYKEIWNGERTAKAEALGMSPAEVVTLCSIVDEETNAQEEKGRIGRLYWNRLQKGMKLQADPTVRFAMGDFTIKRVKSEHLQTDSPYNTYRVAGLPPGPIRTTSVATIDAFLNSSQSEDIYMCADYKFSGRHNFASTYEEHQANARRYQAALDSLGIR